MTKERLRGYRDLLRENLALERQLDAVEATLRRQSKGDEPEDHGVPEDLVVQCRDLRGRYEEKLKTLTGELLDIERAIDALPPTERLLLRLRYLQGLSWEAVCVEMSYSWRQVHRLHAKALADLRGVE